jgi:hypothetical protein
MKYAETLGIVGLAFFQQCKPQFYKGFGILCGKLNWIGMVWGDSFAIHKKLFYRK